MEKRSKAKKYWEGKLQGVVERKKEQESERKKNDGWEELD